MKIQHNIIRNKPTQIALELSNMCNAKCIICPLFQGNDQVDKNIRKPMNMTYALFKKAVHEIKDWCPDSVIFLNMFGEPLLDPDFCKKLELLNELELANNVYLQTNGALLSDEIAYSILKNNVGTVVPCFDGADKETFEKIRCGISFEKALQNITSFVNLRNELKFPTRIALQHVVTPTNQNQHKKCYDLFKPILKQQDVLNIQTATAWSSLALRNLTCLDFQKEQVGFTCDMLENTMIVLSDGNVCACCHDYNLKLGSMGDLNTYSMQEIWNSQKYAALIQSISKGNKFLKTPCTECTYLFANFKKNNNAMYDFDDEVVTAGHHGIVVKFEG